MVRKIKEYSGEFLNSRVVSRRQRLFFLLIACNIGVGSCSLLLDHAESDRAQKKVVEAFKLPKTTKPQQTYEQQVSITRKHQIINQLGKYGLEPLKDPEKINSPDQFMVTADNKCAVQFGVSSDSPGDLKVDTYLIGPVAALTDRRIYDLDGTHKGKTIHAEGQPAIGVNFPSGPKDVGEVVAFIRDKTDYFCELMTNSQ